MGGARTDVLAIAGPGHHPEGWRQATEQRADRLGLRLTWHEVDDEAALISVLGEARAHDAVVLASGSLASVESVATAVRDVDPPVVHVDGDALARLEVVHAACDRVIHGRHRRSFTGALDHLDAEAAHPPTTVPYGEHPAQIGDLRLPDIARSSDPANPSVERAPVVVLLHGGYWLDPYERDLMDRLAVALTGAGWATWNVEYRRRGPSGGGWPATLEDVCAAVDALADLAARYPLDLARVVILGHSAGAQLGFYAATRDRLAEGAPGHVPRPTPIGLVSLAGLLDLEAASDAGLGGDAATAFLGSPVDHADRYRIASPRRRLPIAVPLLAAHGPEDRMVPFDQTTTFADAARAAGDDIEVALVDSSHLDIVDPDGPAADVVLDWLGRLSGA